MWHPAKPLLENRVEFVHCIVIIMHCLLKLCLQSPCCFLNAPLYFSNIKSGSPEYFCLARYRFAKVLVEINKSYIYFSGAVERAEATRTTTPENIKRPTPTCPI